LAGNLGDECPRTVRRFEQGTPCHIGRDFLTSRKLNGNVRQQSALGVEHSEGGLCAGDDLRREQDQPRRWIRARFQLLGSDR
jgi:hypothetical protein